MAEDLTQIKQYGIRVLFYYTDSGELPSDANPAKDIRWNYINLTPFLINLSWSESIRAPYGTVNVDIATDFSSSAPNLTSGYLWPGWLSVQYFNEERACWYVHQAAYVVSTTQDISVDAAGVPKEVTSMQAVSFFDWCGLFSVNICTPSISGSTEQLEQLLKGTFFSIDEWTQIASDIIKDLPTKNVGYALEKAWKAFARVWVPKGAFQGKPTKRAVMLNNLVKVKHSTQFGYKSKAAGNRNWQANKKYGHWHCAPVPGFSIQALKSSMSFGSTLAGLLTQSFVADAGLIEMFPVVDHSAPFLVYRLAPFRVKDLASYGQTVTTAKPTTQMSAEGSLDVALTHFRGATWSKEQADHINFGDISRFTISHQDPGRAATLVTATWPNMPDQLSFIYAQTGLPIIDDYGLYTRGARTYRPAWPFLPSLDKSKSSEWAEKLKEYGNFLRAVAYEAAQYRFGMSYYGVGTITSAYNPTVRCGRPLAIHQKPKNADVVTEYCYTEGVRHSMSVDSDGVFNASSVITFDRYLPIEFEHMRYNPVPIYSPGG